MGRPRRRQADAARAETLNLKEQVTVINQPHWVAFVDRLPALPRTVPSWCPTARIPMTSYLPRRGLPNNHHAGLTADGSAATAIVDTRISEMEKGALATATNGAAMIIDNKLPAQIPRHGR